jgi:cobalt-zinc-cadmium efflux system protein
MTDAFHLATDVGAIGLTSWALDRRSQRPTTKQTFGFHRTGILVAMLNACLLFLIAAGILFAAFLRFGSPAAISPGPMLFAAAIAFFINGAVGASLAADGHLDLNLRSTTLHILTDSATAFAVLISAAIIAVTGFVAADTMVSVLIATMIILGAASLLRSALHILHEGTPSDIDVQAVKEYIAGSAGVCDVHDLHIWSLDSSHRALSAHLTFGDTSLAVVTAQIQAIDKGLCQTFSIEHSTLQAESCVCSDGEVICDPEAHHQKSHAS